MNFSREVDMGEKKRKTERGPSAAEAEAWAYYLRLCEIAGIGPQITPVSTDPNFDPRRADPAMLQAHMIESHKRLACVTEMRRRFPLPGDPPPAKRRHEFFHIRHVCGHSVFWSDGDFAMAASAAPCPWCGGETGSHTVPPEVNMTCGTDPDQPMAFRAFLPGRLVPWPEDRSNAPWLDRYDDGPVIVRHMTGDVCCEPGQASAIIQ
jgi:hypothetical protein